MGQPFGSAARAHTFPKSELVVPPSIRQMQFPPQSLFNTR